MRTSTPSIHVGHHFCVYDKYANVYVQDLRISKKAVYTGCFAPPTHFHQDCPEPTITPTPTHSNTPSVTPTITIPPVCNPPLIYIKEQGNKLGVGGVYKNMPDYVYSETEIYYDKIVDYQGNEKSQGEYGFLNQQGQPSRNNLLHTI